MLDHNLPESESDNELTESFGDLLSQYERSHLRQTEDGSRQLEGTVVSITTDSVLLDIGYKSEGILPLSVFQSAGETVQVGDKFPVTVKGRDPEGYYELTRFKVARPKDWTALERAFARKIHDCRNCEQHREGRLQRRCWGARLHAGVTQRSRAT